MPRYTSAPSLETFLDEAASRGLDREHLALLLRIVGTPPVATHLRELVATLTETFPLVRSIDPVAAGPETKRFTPLLQALASPNHAPWVSGLPSYLPRGFPHGGTLAGFTGQHPVYACLVQADRHPQGAAPRVPRALLLVHRLVPRPLALRGEIAGAEKDAADTVRRALQGETSPLELLRILPSEGDLTAAPLAALTRFLGRVEAASPKGRSRLRLFVALAETLLGGPMKAPAPVDEPDPEPPPARALWVPSPRGHDNTEAWPWPPELGGGLLPGGQIPWKPAPPPTLPETDDAEVDGMDPEECTSGAHLVLPDTTTRPWDPGERALAQFGLRYATLLDHQHLIWRWNALNPHELGVLSEAILAGLNDADAHQRRLSLVLGLMLVLGRSPEELAHVILLEDASQLPGEVLEGSSEAIVLKDGLWVHPTRAPANGYKPKPVALPALEPVVPWLRLPLSQVFIGALRACAPAVPATLLPILQSLGSDPAVVVRGWLRTLRRRHPGLRATPARVRDALYFRLVAESADPIASAFVLGIARVPVGSGRYYAGYPAERMQTLYRDTVARSVPALSPSAAHGIANDPPVGSRLRPAAGVVEGLARALGDSLERQLPAEGNGPSLARAHNAMVLHSLCLLWFATGVRAVTDPFESVATLLPEHDLAVVADKVHQRARDGRPIHLCAMAKAQLEVYLLHLQAVAGRFARHDAALAERIAATVTGGEGRLWLFFLLDLGRDGRWQPVRLDVRRVRAELAAHGWVLPLNTQRHVLAQRLREQGVIPEYIAGQLGHAQLGDHVLGSHSVLSPRSLQPLLEATDALLTRLGWKVRRGVSRHRSRPGDASSDVAALVCTPGHVVRAERRESPPQTRQRLRAVSEQVAPDGRWNGERVKALAERIAALGLDPRDRGRLEQTAGRWLASRAPAALSASGWQPGFLLLAEPAPIDLTHPPLVRAAEALERRLHEVITADPCPEPAETLARILLAATFDGVCHGRRLASLLTAIIRGDYYGWEAMIWVECGSQPFRRRWLAGFLPSLLLLSWRARRLDPPDAIRVRERLVRGWIPGARPGDVLERVADQGAAYARLRLPGYLAAYAREESRSVSLPLGAWMRLLTGRPLATGEVLQPQPSRVTVAGPSRAAHTDASTWKLWRALRETLYGVEQGRVARAVAGKALAELVDPQAAPVARTLAAWACEMLQGTSLAPSTVRGYTLTIGGFLLAAARDLDDYLLLESDDYEELYAQVLEMGAPGNRDYRARRLADYHAFLETRYQAPPVDSGLFRGTGTGPDVSANLLTLPEYDRARGIIESDDAQAVENRRLAALSLALLFWCGPRVGEWRRARVCDLLFPEPGVVLIRSFARRRTKTVRGQRQIPSTGRMPDVEWESLAQWCQRRRAEAGPRARVFAPEPDFDLQQYLTWVIRRASGETGLELRSLRHSATTYTVLWADPPGGGLPEGWGDVDPMQLRHLWFGAAQALPTRRTLYQVAVHQGHVSPTTTLHHYTHLLDWRLGRERPLMAFPPLATIAALAGLSPENVRVIRHRAETDQAFCHEILGRGVAKDGQWGAYLSGLVAAESPASDDGRIGDLEHPSIEATGLRISDIEEILDLAVTGSEPERISARTRIPLDLVRRVIASARDAIRWSGFAEWVIDGSARIRGPRAPRDPRYRAWVAGLEDAIRRRDQRLRSLFRLWRARYQAGSLPLPVADIDEAAAVLHGLLAAGVDARCLLIVAPVTHPLCCEPDMLRALAVRVPGWHARVATGAAMTARGVVGRRRGLALGVAVSGESGEEGPVRARGVRSWHRSVFLGWLLDELHGGYTNEKADPK